MLLEGIRDGLKKKEERFKWVWQCISSKQNSISRGLEGYAEFRRSKVMI